MKLKLKHQ
jgi:hypothetical protein